MKHILSILALTLALGGSLQAQESRAALIEYDGKMAVFSVDATAAKSGDVADAAIRQVFLILLDEGVEGINNGGKLMQHDNAKWRDNFFKDKNSPYMSYVKGIQTEGEPLKTSVGEYGATVLVRVNIEFLVRQLRAYGIMDK